jgi:predicted ATPase
VELLGRRRERDELDRFIQAVRDGKRRALVVFGEPGIGKTALLNYVAEHAQEATIVAVEPTVLGLGKGGRR